MQQTFMLTALLVSKDLLLSANILKAGVTNVWPVGQIRPTGELYGLQSFLHVEPSISMGLITSDSRAPAAIVLIPMLIGLLFQYGSRPMGLMPFMSFPHTLISTEPQWC